MAKFFQIFSGCKMSMPWPACLLALGCLTLDFASWTPAVHAQSETGALKNFETGMADLARALNERLEGLNGKNNKLVGISPFLGPPGSNFPRMFDCLKRHLESNECNCKVVKTGLASWNITGEYAIGQRDATSGQLPIVIKAVIRDRNNNSQTDIHKEIFTDGTTGLSSLLGLSNELPVALNSFRQAPDELDAAELERLRQAVEDASIRDPRGRLMVAGQSLVKTSAASPYGVEVLLVALAKDGKPLLDAAGNPQYEAPLPARQDPGGFMFVDIPPGRLYAIRLINESDQDAGVTLSVDGINIFAFSNHKAWRELGKVVLPAGTSKAPGAGLIRGWHHTKEQSNFFEITKIGDSAAAELGRLDGGIGTITATFCTAFPNQLLVPLLQRELAGIDRGEVATGRGPVVTQQYNEVQRVFGLPQATISLRYTLPDAP